MGEVGVKTRYKMPKQLDSLICSISWCIIVIVNVKCLNHLPAWYRCKLYGTIFLWMKYLKTKEFVS